MNKDIKCPTCKEGKINIHAHIMQDDGSFKPEDPTEINCVICNGDGVIDQDTQDMIDYEKSIWCKCEDSPGADYHGDGQGGFVHKHHWTCKDCGRVVQIG